MRDFDALDDDFEADLEKANAQAEAEADELAELVEQIVDATVEKAISDIRGEIRKAVDAVPKPDALSEANLQGQIRGFLRAGLSEELSAAMTAVDNNMARIRDALTADLAQVNSSTADGLNAALAAIRGAEDALNQLRTEAANTAQTAGAAGVVATSAATVAGKATEAVQALSEGLRIKGAYPITALADKGWQEAKRGWPAGVIVLHNGGYWLSIAPTQPRDEPGATSKVWRQCGLAFAGFVGATSSKAMRESGNNVPFFTQDSTNVPDPKPGNAATVGGLATAHIKGWVQTDTMATFVAMDSGNGVWSWVETSKGGGGGGAGLPNPRLPNAALQTSATNVPSWSPTISEGTF